MSGAFGRRLIKEWLAASHLLGVAKSLREAGRRMAWDRNRAHGEPDRAIVVRYLAAHQPRKLHIGCGDHLLQGWLNADYRPTDPSILHLDATKPFAVLADGVLEHVFSEHMIEHISYQHGLSMLAECHRVLRPGGMIRISTPDLAFLVELYRDPPSELQARYLAWSTERYPQVLHPEPTFVINNFVRDWGHVFIYDEPTLRRALEHSGFSSITRKQLQMSDEPTLRNLENESRMPPGFLALETLTLEAHKR